jgi:D-alanyl-D-alanine carboxypeptidase
MRLGLLGLAAATAFVIASTSSADARKRKHRTSQSTAQTYNPKFASIIVDAKSGAVLQSANADAARHPASLTKVMTLYLLFEQIESGKLKLDSELAVSVRASRQSPTKLGLRPGQTISVEDAIQGLVTRSANDAAVVVAEAIAGDEDDFARMMTRKARALGMTRTVYRNASGLPNDDQVTTARDQATLGRAIQERFPRYYRYFATQSFKYKGRNIRNHNHLLGKVEGIDGIKTGYIRASGFNIVTSLRRGNRHLVGVVMGGRSAGARDATMRKLLAENLDKATTRQTVAAITERSVAEANAAVAADAANAQPSRTIQVEGAVKVATSAAETDATPTPRPRPQAAPIQVAAAAPAAPAAPPAPLTSGIVATGQMAAIPGSSEPIKPLRVRTVQVRAGHLKEASPTPRAPITVASASSDDLKTAALPPQPANHGTGNGVLGVLPASHTGIASAAPVPPPAPAPQAPQQAVQENGAIKPESAHSGGMIQVGALETEAQARARLEAARGQAQKLLNNADPFTEPVVSKGNKTLYRARFAGLDRGAAEAACRTLRRSDISCITLRN